MNQKSNSFYRKSVFKRILCYYIIISFITIIIFCFVWYQSTSKWIENRNLSYNHQQLETLFRTMEMQHQNLKQAQFRLYTYNLPNSDPLYIRLKKYIEILADNEPEDQLRIQEYKLSLDNYISTIERPGEKGMSFFMFSGNEYNYQNVFFLRSNMHASPEYFSRSLFEKVQNTQCTPSRRATNTVPTFTLDNDDFTNDTYIIYDMLRVTTAPQQIFGYIITAYKTSVFDNVLSEFMDPLIGRAYIVDHDGYIIYDSEHKKQGEQWVKFEIPNKGKLTTLEINGTKTTVLSNHSFGFSIIGELSSQSALSLNQKDYLNILYAAIFSCISSVIISIMIIRSTSRRISALIKVLHTAKYNIKKRAVITGSNDEIDSISNNLNSMLDQIENNRIKSYEKEIEQQALMLHQKESELYALQSQIDPHFLYNTLEIIRMKALSNHDEETSMMIKGLATIFRERIKGETVISLRQELIISKQIIEIYNIRYGNFIELEENIDIQLLSLAVPRNILAPLLENAVIHGFSDLVNRDDMLVVIQGEKNDDDFTIQVSDNGIGMSVEKLREIQERLNRPDLQNNYHVGLLNVHNRLRLVYGENYGMTIHSIKGEGTVIRLHLKFCFIDELNEMVKKIQGTTERG